LFAAILGLTRPDAEQLKSLILKAIQQYEAKPGRADEYGQRYAVTFPLTRNHSTATICTTWIVRINGNLSTVGQLLHRQVTTHGQHPNSVPIT
jgi:hypothetical protein